MSKIRVTVTYEYEPNPDNYLMPGKFPTTPTIEHMMEMDRDCNGLSVIADMILNGDEGINEHWEIVE